MKSAHSASATIFVCLLLGATGLSAALQTPSAVKSDRMTIGVLPFVDATASGNTRVGADVGQTMLTELTRSTTLIPRLLATGGSMAADNLNGEKAVAIGREKNVDLVFLGTVLDATTEESTNSGWIPSIKGQSANVRLRRVKATVTLHGELYEVATGARLFSHKITGKKSNNAVRGTAHTKFGTWGNDDYGAFLESPLGQALETAVAEMTKKIAATKRSSP